MGVHAGFSASTLNAIIIIIIKRKCGKNNRRGSYRDLVAIAESKRKKRGDLKSCHYKWKGQREGHAGTEGARNGRGPCHSQLDSSSESLDSSSSTNYCII